MTQHYKITKHFTGGALKGYTLDEITTAKFEVGQRVDRPIGGSSYEITAVEPIEFVPERDWLWEGGQG